MYSTIPMHWNIKSAPVSSGRSRVGPLPYVFSLLDGSLTETRKKRKYIEEGNRHTRMKY
jgi:hypothetical protein